jgi:hypothetical protein
MKKLFLTEFDTPVHLTINGAGTDKKADYNDNTDTWGYILKNCTSMNLVQTSRYARYHASSGVIMKNRKE